MLNPDGMAANDFGEQDMYGRSRFDENGLYIAPTDRGVKKDIEPPTHMFGKSEDGKSLMSFYKGLEKKSQSTKGDGNFVVMAHGSDKDGDFFDMSDGGLTRISSAKEFDAYMKANNPQFRKAVEEKKNFTLTLLICWSATKFSDEDSMAQQISKLYPWATISGIDDRAYFSDEASNPYFAGIGNEPRAGRQGAIPNNQQGKMRYYQNNVETYSVSSSTLRKQLMPF